MELERVYEGDILGKEEWFNGRWRFLYGPVTSIDKEKDFVVLKIREGREFVSMSFKSEDLWPIYVIVFRKNKTIQWQNNAVRVLERFIVALIKGRVSEGGAQEVLELFQKRDD